MLNLNGTSVLELNYVEFPSLKVFTHTSNCILSMSKVALPSTLEELDFTNQEVEDWDRTKFPDGLKVLKLVTLDPNSLRLPPSLETLHIMLPNESRVRYSELRLPATLTLLKLVNGISEEFDWNLPKLLEFTDLYFEGPISIPDLVEILHLEAKSRQVIEEDDFDPYGFEDHSFAPGEYWQGENIGEGW